MEKYAGDQANSQALSSTSTQETPNRNYDEDNSCSPEQPLLPRQTTASQGGTYATFSSHESELVALRERQTPEDIKHMHSDLISLIDKTNYDEPTEMALDMALSSIDLSFFTLPLCFHSMGFITTTGFYFYLHFFSLMACQCYIELKRLSTIAQKNSWQRDHVGLIDLIDECCEPNSNSMLGGRMLVCIKWYLKLVAITTLVGLLACNQCFTAIIIQRSISGVEGVFSIDMNAEASEEVQVETITQWNHSYPLQLAILFCIWITGYLIKTTRASKVSLITMVLLFVSLATCSVIWTCWEKGFAHTQAPPLLPNDPGEVDTAFGFLTSFMILPLLTVTEDQRDYSRAGSASPADSKQSFWLYTSYSVLARYFVGLILCFTVAASSVNEINLDPFQVVLACVFIITSVCSKMTAFLYKFTESHIVSTLLPCTISLVLLMISNAKNGQVNSIANYVALFLAYQFLIIIPFGLFYLRTSQLTQVQEGDAAADDNELEVSLLAEQTTLAAAPLDSEETDEQKRIEAVNKGIVDASKRIFIVDYLSNMIIGESAEKAKLLALTFVGSGFKTLAVMLVLTFWGLTCFIFSGVFNYIYNLFGGS